MWFHILQAAFVGYLLYKLIEFYMSRNDNYWKERGIPTVYFSDVASWYQIFTGKVSLPNIDKFFYNRYPAEKFIGTFEFGSPVLIIRDLDLAKQIYIKDFDHFVDRRTFHTGEELSEKFLFNMQGAAWKDMRSAMSPVFTTNKIRRMFPCLEKSTEQFKQYVKEEIKRTGSNEIVLRDLFGRYTMDVIAGTAFGVDARCLVDQNSLFLDMGKRIQSPNAWRTFKASLAVFLPKVFLLTGLTSFDMTSINFFKSIINKAILTRRANKGQFYDFIAAFVEQMEGKNVDGIKEAELDTFEQDALLKNSSAGDGQQQQKIMFSDKEILANSLSFFFAGFDTTENLMTLAAYHMALDAEVQSKVYEEIMSVTEEFDGRVTYDGIAKMQYMDMLVHEVLRLYPVVGRNERRVSKPWTVPGTDVVLPLRTLVAIPTIGFHSDPNIFPDPEKFDPERFSPENKQKMHPYAWMPFGHGPRGCIAMRFALIEAKAAIAHLVLNFEVHRCNDTWVPMRFDNIPGGIKAKPGLKVALTPRI